MDKPNPQPMLDQRPDAETMESKQQAAGHYDPIDGLKNLTSLQKTRTATPESFHLDRV